MQKNIDKAQAYIDQNKAAVSQGKMRQNYHFMPQTGWLNDPNGLIYYKGKYHIFYQFNPYYGHWDYMHWGHAVSEDLVHWEYLPLALAPSEFYDDHYRGGCFSGSAIEHDGKLFLMFTGCTNNGNGFEQTQCIAYSEDGIHFEKYENNPVLTAPEGVPSYLFRDPKVWKHGDKYYMICGASRNNFAQALLYVSEDMLHWEFFSVLAESRGEWGYMWECPDFFQLGDKYVLLYLLWEQASGPAYIWSAISATRQENLSTTSAVKRTGDSIFMHHSHSLMEKAEDLSSDGQTVGIGCHSGKTGARPIGKAGADFSLCQER